MRRIPRLVTDLDAWKIFSLSRLSLGLLSCSACRIGSEAGPLPRQSHPMLDPCFIRLCLAQSDNSNSLKAVHGFGTKSLQVEDAIRYSEKLCWTGVCEAAAPDLQGLSIVISCDRDPGSLTCSFRFERAASKQTPRRRRAQNHGCDPPPS